jgi:hypothetical protein
MKWYVLEGLGVLCVLLASTAQAASFSPNHEMTYCNSDALTRADVPEPNEFTDPYDELNPNFNATESVTYIEVQPDEYVVANSQTEMFIYIATSGETFTDNNIQLYSNSYSFAEITTPKGEEAFAWGGAATVAPGFATGNFYEITPEAGESTGDWVTVTVDYWAYIETMSEGGSSTSAIVDGGWAGNDLLITRNCADYDDPQPDEIVCTFDMQEFDGEYNDQAAFMAQIGDIIGIHGGVYTNAYTGTHPGTADATADLSLYLTLSEGTAPPLTAADADIDGSGRVDLGDLAILAQFWLETIAVNNDACSNAIALTIDVPVLGNNFDATGGPMDTCSSGSDGKDVWYSFTAPWGSWYNIDVLIDDPEQFDSTLSVWDACGGEQQACQENYGSESITYYYMDEGTTIYIRVAGYDGPIPDEGEFTVSVTSALN